MKKKILALCLVVALMTVAIAGATLAYFTDTAGDMTNTFTVGKVDIKLDEEDITKNDGTRTEEGNKYEDIYPGVKLPKDPTVTVIGGSEESYVRMKVTVNVDTLAKAFPVAEYPTYWGADGVFLLQNLVNWDPTLWEYKSCTNGTYEFWYHETVKEAAADTKLDPLFTEITIPVEMTNAQISVLEGFNVVVSAEAIQAATFANADAAWAAFSAAAAEAGINQNFNEQFNDSHI